MLAGTTLLSSWRSHQLHDRLVPTVVYNCFSSLFVWLQKLGALGRISVAQINTSKSQLNDIQLCILKFLNCEIINEVYFSCLKIRNIKMIISKVFLLLLRSNIFFGWWRVQKKNRSKRGWKNRNLAFFGAIPNVVLSLSVMFLAFLSPCLTFYLSFSIFIENILHGWNRKAM